MRLDPRDHFSPTRRSALLGIGELGLLAALGRSGPSLAQISLAATPAALSTTQATWRAMSRVGYGPTPALLRSLESAASPKEWALAQVDLALAASRSPPAIPPENAGFNAPLPELMAGFQRERQARATGAPKLQKDNLAATPSPTAMVNVPDAEPFSRSMVQQAAAWRLASCSQPDLENPLLARLTEFWFNHLNVFSGKGAVRPFTGHYVVNVARAHALGKFENLLLASARHPAMLQYLDQAQSVAAGARGPQGQARGLNENYARELMELHTLGVNGGYTQTDVRELARVLTGWTVSNTDASGYRFAPRQHDTQTKQVLGQVFPSSVLASGEAEGVEAIRLLARHPATARRVCLRLAQFFVADQPPPQMVKHLGDVFLSTQGDLRAVMRSLLAAPEFWQSDQTLFKTPMDFACSALAATQALTADVAPATPERRPVVLTLGFLGNAGQPLHGWQTPDGYPFDAATWMAPEALTRRADYALALARQTPELSFLDPYLSAATREAISREKPALRAGLALASPDFMYK